MKYNVFRLKVWKNWNATMPVENKMTILKDELIGCLRSKFSS